MSSCTISPNTLRPTSGPVRWSPWACCMRATVAGIILLSLAHTRLPHVVPPPPRADAALSALQNPSGVEASLLGLSNYRWIVGGTLCLLVNQYGLVVGWDCATANVAEHTFQWLMRQVDGRMIVLRDRKDLVWGKV